MLPLYNRIEALCKEKDITITDLCRNSGISRSLLSDYKAGRTRTLGAQIIEKIAKYFGVPYKYFTNEPPFDAWEHINKDEDRTKLLHRMFITTETFKELTGEKDISNLSLAEYIKFVDSAIESIKFAEDGLIDVITKSWVEVQRAAKNIDSTFRNKKNSDESEYDNSEEIIILNRAAKNMSPEDKKKLLEMAQIMFEDAFPDKKKKK